MTSFIDTSSLIKRYVLEAGSQKFLQILVGLNNIIVSPVTLIELHSCFRRRLRDGDLSLGNYQKIEKELERNFQDFSVVACDDNLIMTAVILLKKYNLRTLDAIQLASAVVVDAPEFITSDHKLALAAKKEINKVLII